jgi:hypothetical protein
MGQFETLGNMKKGRKRMKNRHLSLYLAFIEV